MERSIYLDLWFQRGEIPPCQEAWEWVAGIAAGSNTIKKPTRMEQRGTECGVTPSDILQQIYAM